MRDAAGSHDRALRAGAGVAGPSMTFITVANIVAEK
jgi:hypothetical protein